MRTKTHQVLAIVSLVGAFAAPAEAQNIDKAITAFKRSDFEVAAAQFYAVLRFENEEQGDVAEAQYGLAKSFEKLGLPLAALKYYEDILDVGSDHPHFDKAVEGMLNVGESLEDDLKAPQVLDQTYSEKNTSALQKINPATLQRVHFVLGKYLFERGKLEEAKAFFTTVKPGNPSYASAQYMLGLYRLGVGRPKDSGKVPKYDIALEAFGRARDAIAKGTTDKKLQELRDLTTLAIARTAYEQAYRLDDGDPKRREGLALASQEFKAVPHYSDAWAQALFESAWASTVNSDYGKALGALHSLRAPYFAGEFYPEARILQAIIYYYNCQWDRVNEVLTETRGTYEPMVQQLTAIRGSNLADDEWYPLYQKSLGSDGKDPNLVPLTISKALEKDPKLAKMETFLRELEREATVFQKNATFAQSDMGREMTDFANATRDEYLKVIGRYVKSRLGALTEELSDITTRAQIVALETKTAEAEWLEQGKAIENKFRKRQPRPFIPDDTFQFWWFRNEYWVDELGFYEYTIKTECFEEAPTP